MLAVFTSKAIQYTGHSSFPAEHRCHDILVYYAYKVLFPFSSVKKSKIWATFISPDSIFHISQKVSCTLVKLAIFPINQVFLQPKKKCFHGNRLYSTIVTSMSTWWVNENRHLLEWLASSDEGIWNDDWTMRMVYNEIMDGPVINDQHQKLGFKSKAVQTWDCCVYT